MVLSCIIQLYNLSRRQLSSLSHPSSCSQVILINCAVGRDVGKFTFTKSCQTQIGSFAKSLAILFLINYFYVYVIPPLICGTNLKKKFVSTVFQNFSGGQPKYEKIRKIGPCDTFCHFGSKLSLQDTMLFGRI